MGANYEKQELQFCTYNPMTTARYNGKYTVKIERHSGNKIPHRNDIKVHTVIEQWYTCL